MTSSRLSDQGLKRTTPLLIATLLLVTETAGLVVLMRLTWLRVAPLFATNTVLPTPTVLDVILLLVACTPLALLAIPAAAGLFNLRRWGWLLAMLVQSGLLGVCLYFFFGLPDSIITRSGVIYGMMAYCIVTVLYLNSTDVRLAVGDSVVQPSGAEMSGGQRV